ncbi:MAG: S-layer homology domain-containing protein [Candidatus Melainabacteria bacterium]|nr:S-layer homology domain-containing protein [Candidatus Melainabacteria bacterium]
MRLSRVKPALVAVLFAANSLISPAYAARFVDLGSSWAEKCINELSDKGVIQAEADGKFKPTEPVTRAVLSMWMVRALGLENQPVSPQPSFPDVKPSDPYYKYVEIIRQNNYIAGFSDGFRPNQFIQLGEVIVIAARALRTQPPDEGTVERVLSRYEDGSKVPQWARVGVAQAAESGLLEGDEKPNSVDATTIATRASAASIIFRLQQTTARKDIADSTAQAVSGTGGTSAAPNMASSQLPGAEPAYQGRVSEQGQPNYGTGQPGYPQGQMPPQMQPQMPPQNPYAGGAQQGYPPMQPQFPQAGGYPPANPYLSGRVAVVAAGTKLQASLKNTLDSGSTQPGEPVEATLGAAIYSGSMEVVPAGSKLVGQVTNVVSARRFKFGANGKIDIRFTQIETPDGRRVPLSASIDDNQLRLTGGTTAGRVGKGLVTTGVGAAGGAALGTALGAIVGATGGGQVGRSTGMGAVFGTALGGGVGAVGAVVRKGSEITIPAGTNLPIQLDESMQVTASAPPPMQYGYNMGGGYGAQNFSGQGYQQRPPGNLPQYSGDYPPQGGYPPAQGYPQPPQGGYPPPQGGYPPQQGGYPQ